MRVASFTCVAALVLCSTGSLMAQPPAYLTGLQTPSAPSTGGLAAITQADRDAYLADAGRQSFPRLGTQFTVLAPASKDYNAYSAVLGITDRWTNPEASTAQNPFAGMDKLLGQGGYRRSATFDLSVRPGTQKVVVYGKLQPDGDVAEITHAIAQMADGKWSAKCGQWAMIQIADPGQLRGPTYGLPVAVYERAATPAPTVAPIGYTPTVMLPSTPAVR